MKGQTRSNRDILEALRAAVNPQGKQMPTLVCIVSKVDAAQYTCDCEPIDGSGTIYGVKLNADGSNSFVMLPEVDSFVVVTMTSKTTGVVVMYSTVSAIYLKGDTFGGLIKIDDLKTQYDSFVSGIKAACAAGFTALAALDGGASSAAFNASAASILPLNKTTLENKKVQHGAV